MNFGLERAFESRDMYTIIFVLVFVLLTAVRLKYPQMFIGFMTSLFSKTFFLDFSNDLKGSFNGFKGFLFLIQNLIFSLFLYQVYTAKIGLINKSDWSLFFVFFVGVSSFFIVQYAISSLVSRIFNFVDVFNYIYIVKFTYLKLVALALLPVLLFMSYGEVDDFDFLIVVSIAFFALLMLLRAVLVMFKNNKVIIENLFYFIVYLCTLEIVPLLLIIKVVVNK